jgi:hypothetical protein
LSGCDRMGLVIQVPGLPILHPFSETVFTARSMASAGPSHRNAFMA